MRYEFDTGLVSIKTWDNQKARDVKFNVRYGLFFEARLANAISQARRVERKNEANAIRDERYKKKFFSIIKKDKRYREWFNT